MPNPDLIYLDDLTINFASYRLLRDGQPIRLTPTEWSLLRELTQHPNQVLTHRTLLKRVWGEEYETELDYVHTYVSRLRRKLEPDPSNPMYILTEAGIGYRFNGHTIAPNPQPAPTTETAQPATPPRYINPLPQLVGERYVGRQTQREYVRDLLTDGARMVSLYGRAGVGKTALACRVITDLQTTDHFDGMVFLSATSTGITLGRILSDFNRLLDDAPLPDHQQAVYRITHLLDRLQNGRYLLLLDNLEHLQNPLTNDLTDKDMEIFFKVVLEQGGGLRILATSRYPLNLPRSVKMWERVVSLEQGLHLTDGIALLRQSDPDGHAGLANAPAEILSQLVARTHGLPRALEAIVGILLESPLMSPADLLNDTALLADEIGEMFIQGVIDTLPADAVRVMELVSMFRRAVPLPLLEAFTAPHLQPGTLKPVLNRLVRAYFLTYSPSDERVSMHPLDRAYCYGRIPTDDRRQYHNQIADLYAATFVDDGRVTNIADLSVPLAAFQHRVLAAKYDQAATLLLELDREYLSIWGNHAELADNYAQVAPHIHDPRLQRDATLRYGEALRRIGKLHDAIHAFEQVNHNAAAANDRHSQADAQRSLGWAYYDTGQFPRSIDYWKQALDVFQQIGDHYRMGDLLSGMGWVSYLMGAYDEALHYLQQSFLIFGEIGDQLHRIGVNIGDSGMIRAAQGHYTQAIRNLRESLSIAEVTNAINEKSYKGGYLAVVLLLDGQFDQAEAAARTAVQYDVPANRHFVAAVHGIALARLNRTDEAIQAFEDALRYADSILRFTSGLYHARYAHALALAGLALLRADDLIPAVEDYGAALAMCATAGVIELNLNLLKTLDPDHKLDGVRSLLTG